MFGRRPFRSSKHRSHGYRINSERVYKEIKKPIKRPLSRALECQRPSMSTRKPRRSARIQRSSQQAERPDAAAAAAAAATATSSSSEERPRASLITSIIKYDDDLPRGWMFHKRKRRSDGDIQELREYLERISGINPLRPDIPRGASMPYLESSPSKSPLFFGGSRERVTSGRTSFSAYLMEQWRAIALQFRRCGWDLRNNKGIRPTVRHGPRMPGSTSRLATTVTRAE